MKNWKHYALAAVIGLTTAVSVQAEDAAPAATAPAESRPCHEDLQKFCKDVPKGGGARQKCLKEHRAEASVACQAHMQEKKKRFEALKAACKTDRDTFCKDKKGRDLHNCMRDNEAKISQTCKDAKAAASPKPPKK